MDIKEDQKTYNIQLVDGGYSASVQVKDENGLPILGASFAEHLANQTGVGHCD